MASQSNDNNYNKITDFITGFNGGRRQNRFKVTANLTSDTYTTGVSTTNFHIRTASLPSSTLGAIPINFRGRTVVYPGERVYAPWAITVIDDSVDKSGLYESFHEWSEQINDHDTNRTNPLAISGPGDNNGPMKHFADNLWTIEHLDVNSGTLLPTAKPRRFKLHNCWPIQIGDIMMDMGADNQLVTFNVTVVFSHMDLIDYLGDDPSADVAVG